ncbi:MAG: PAS domain S-box protein [Planctomycetaceae bacterium]|jgi:PAS domain S-box-containing protein|nr:PAS domain S-box protein [Planctomycetaceae bacterium]
MIDKLPANFSFTDVFHQSERLARSGSWIFEPAQNIEIFSEGLRYLLGIDDGTDASLFELFPDIKPRIDSFARGRVPYLRYQWNAKDRDGDDITLLLQITKHNHDVDNSQQEYYLGVIQDITEIVPPPSPQSLGDQLLTNVLAFDELFAMIIDVDERIAYIDGRGALRAGFDHSVIGQKIDEVFGAKSEVSEQIRAAYHDQPTDVIWQVNESYIEYRFNPLYDQRGTVCGVIGFAIDITQRVVAIRSVEESELKYRTLFDNSRDAIALLDQNGHILFCNSKLQQMLNIPAIEMKGQTIPDFSPTIQFDGRISRDYFDSVITQAAAGMTQQFEWVYKSNYGELVHAFVHISSLVIGGETYLLHMAYDRTEQIVAKRNEFMLIDVFACIREGILLLDTNMNIVRANDAIKKLYQSFDFSEGNVCSLEHRDTKIVNETSFDLPPILIQKNNTQETVSRFEDKTDVNEARWVECTTLPIIDQRRGQATLFFITVRDITMRVNADNELKRYRDDLEKMINERTEQLVLSEARLRGVLEGSSSAIHFFDVDFKTTYTNPAFQQLIGYTADELTGKPISDVLCNGFPETLEAMNNLQSLLNSSEHSCRVDVPLRNKNNTITWVDSNISSIRDSHGTIQQIVAVMADITKNRNLLRELKGTISVAENEKDAARAANTSKSEFLAHMSHEIRTPLNGVIGLCDLLLQTELESKQLEYAQLIRESGKSLLHLINDILDFSKIEAGKLDIDNSVFNLYELVESVLGILETRAESKGIELCSSFDPHIPSIVFADSGRIRQILINLIGNAIKFTDTGGVRIHLFFDQMPTTTSRLENVPSGSDGNALPYKSVLRFQVIDSGIGIPKDRMERLFKSFSQVDSSTARMYGGTGLGLAISIRLANLMGGEMGVESEEGNGTMFWFTLPVYHELPFFDKTETLPKTAITGKNLALIDGKRVLIVDDNALQRQSLQTQLSLWSMRAVECSTAACAAELLKTETVAGRPFDVIIVDKAIGDGDGTNLITELSKNGEYAKLPQILLMPLSAESGLDKSLLNNNVKELTKPLSNNSLFSAIITLLFGCEQADEKAAANSVIENDKQAVDDAALFKRRTGIRVLVAEDNRINQIVVKDTLNKAGYESITVDNGRLAFERVMTERFDIILMDCMMPEMDGYEATRQIREWERKQVESRNNACSGRVPIIALTANATTDDEQKCLAAGMDAFCSKPINPKLLIEMIDKRCLTNQPVYHKRIRDAMPDSDEMPIIISHVEKQCGGDKDAVRKLLENFKQQLPKDYAEIEHNYKENNHARMLTIIHSIIGSTGLLGSLRLQKLCDEVEAATNSQDSNQLEEKIVALRDEVRRCCEFMESL